MAKSLLIFMALLFMAIPVQAGEYGLAISFDSKKPCSADISKDLNSCHPDSVIEDLKGFFVEGKEFRIKAVRMGHWSGWIWLGDKGEKLAFYRGLVSILIRDDLKKGDELITFMLRFPYKSMRQALEEEISKGGHSESARSRLEQVYSAVTVK